MPCSNAAAPRQVAADQRELFAELPSPAKDMRGLCPERSAMAAHTSCCSSGAASSILLCHSHVIQVNHFDRHLTTSDRIHPTQPGAGDGSVVGCWHGMQAGGARMARDQAPWLASKQAQPVPSPSIHIAV